MMFPRSYSAPVPARETEPEAPTEPTPRPEPAPWVSPRVLLLLGLAVLAIAYAQHEATNAPPTVKLVTHPTGHVPAVPSKPATTVVRDEGAPAGSPYVVTKAGAYGCTAYPLTEQIEAAVALGTSLKEIATVRPELVAECITLNVGETVTTAWSGREHETLLRVRKAGERYVHWVPRRFLRKQDAATR
jgi:hypothetical protein